ncbi:tetratricopeptide repeat protein [Nevskia sp.]|uniref:tetratricopeptide repeat protein n=1 Tax=Nevskia sp. TaxID=1929292 RepID=UPI0025F08F4C|nr:tetratricopeptide repeat protein [Nevskia sp.]
MRVFHRHHLVAALILVSGSVFAEASIDEVYRTAAAGHLSEAQSMMQEVLKAHPDSAKAHFVEAELLVRQNNNGAARAELARATAIDPGLAFAKPQAVEALKTSLGATHQDRPIQASGPVPSHGMSFWFWPLAAGLLIVALLWKLGRNRGFSPVPAARMATPYGETPSPAYGPAAPAAAPGVGSGLLGSLATGAAIGGGMVAGEMLVHRLLDGPSERGGGYAPTNNDRANDRDRFSDQAPADPTMGGQDFGIDNASSWDDDSSRSDDGGW